MIYSSVLYVKKNKNNPIIEGNAFPFFSNLTGNIPNEHQKNVFKVNITKNYGVQNIVTFCVQAFSRPFIAEFIYTRNEYF